MVSPRQSSQSSLLRDAWVEIDLNAIEHNVAKILSWLKPEATKLMAVVKSDAYGHGATRVAEILVASGAKWLAVASVDEGLRLRDSDQNTPILILGPSPFWAVDDALSKDLDLTVTSIEQIKAIESLAFKANRQARIHLKVDTGMHRLGISIDKVKDALNLIYSSKNLDLKSVFSHLALASDASAVDFQHARFLKIKEEVTKADMNLLFHIASSEATEKFPQTHHDMVRAGIFLYGLRPKTSSLDLIPAMSVRGRIMNIVDVPTGESAGYNWTWTADSPSRLASIPIGYADGVDRNLSNKTSGYLMGKKIKQVGMISMDQMLFDITSVPEATEGDVITLIGHDEANNLEPLILADWANELETITYELACRLRARLARVYTRKPFKNENLQKDIEISTG